VFFGSFVLGFIQDGPQALDSTGFGDDRDRISTKTGQKDEQSFTQLVVNVHLDVFKKLPGENSWKGLDVCGHQSIGRCHHCDLEYEYCGQPPETISAKASGCHKKHHPN